MSVYQVINKVQRALAAEGIGKDRKNQAQGYSFRGIDDMYNALAPILAAEGLCILPRALSRECVERVTAKGSAIFYVTVEVEFDFVSAEDGSKHVVKTYGEAMDSADKATNKAMSAAYKYAVMQAFSIPTQGDNDADAHTHEVAPRQKAVVKESLSPAARPYTMPPADPKPPPMPETVVADWLAAIGSAADEEELRSFRADGCASAQKAKDETAYRAIRSAAVIRAKELGIVV